MNPRLLSMASALALSTIATAATAEWMHEVGLNDPFKGGAQQTVGYIEKGFDAEHFGMLCHTSKDLGLIWKTSEKVPYNARDALKRMRFRIALIVDGQPTIYVPARGSVGSIDKLVLAVHDAKSASVAVLALAKAEREIAIAGELDGKIIFSKPLPIANAAESVKKLVDACGIKEPIKPVGSWSTVTK